jgi:hypothetical protein
MSRPYVSWGLLTLGPAMLVVAFLKVWRIWPFDDVVPDSYASDDGWGSSAVLLAVVAVFGAAFFLPFIIWRGTRNEHDEEYLALGRGGKWMLLVNAALLAGLIAGAPLARSWRDPAHVHVDNFTPNEVAVSFGDEASVLVPSGATSKLRLRAGEYRVVVRDRQSAVLDELTVEVEPNKGRRRRYVFNVLGAHTYYAGRQQYGFDPRWDFGRRPRTFEEIKKVWFEADADHVFQEPPASVRVPEHSKSAGRSFLLRDKPKDPPDAP